MDRMETGLQHRLRRAVRQMAAQHRHLEPIRELLTRALQRNAQEEAQTAFDRYREAIEAHFDLEERLFFPALHGLHPDRAEDLDALSREHERFLHEMGEIYESLCECKLSECAEAVDGFLSALTGHERREERLVVSMLDTSGAAEERR